ncbi:MAG: NAD-dependent epimerase/dehydratase family protein [Pseudomonadota bacterium]
MKLLFIGGTRFLGHAMATEALARDHEVDLFHRGKTPAQGLDGARHLHGDRVTDLSALAKGQWDAVIDTCAYRPRDVDLMAHALGTRFRKYVFVSSASVYASDIPPDSAESAPRTATGGLDKTALDTLPINGETYGPLKVLCEDAVFAHHVDHLVLRPTFVIGPNDYTQRFPEWVRRIAAGGVVDAPGPREAAVQYIDARDLARFTISAVEANLRGTFNAASPQVPFGFGDLLDAVVQAVAPASTRLNWLTPAQAKASGKEFPLWGGGESSGVAAINSDAARANGLVARPLEETARDTLAWLSGE